MPLEGATDCTDCCWLAAAVACFLPNSLFFIFSNMSPILLAERAFGRSFEANDADADDGPAVCCCTAAAAVVTSLARQWLVKAKLIRTARLRI